MPRVSVIVPAFNSSPHLGETLRSISAQTFGDWETVVVDDCSQDDTFEIASGFEKGVRAIRTERNLGPAGARNLGIQHAGGELIAFLDADDIWLPGYLEQQVSRFDLERARGHRIAIVACNALLAGDEEGTRRTFLDHFRPPVEEVTLDGLLRGNCIFISALVLRTAIEQAGGFAVELFGTEDHDLWIRILELGYGAALNPEVLAVYRQPPGSISSNLTRMGLYNQATYRRALARGRLTGRQRRIARAQLRYNRAMEAVAAARFDGNVREALKRLPLLVVVALTHPGSWGDWLRVIRAR